MSAPAQAAASHCLAYIGGPSASDQGVIDTCRWAERNAGRAGWLITCAIDIQDEIPFYPWAQATEACRRAAR
ncbi:hypothetical protein [Streptosporangium sp. NPDC023615]|uniref:hypothetical protein n=1 Tax=Streptosporangium sp. NPDC023615 TaxID=3154794 RepID=UPI003430708F